jgi:hypothetical protein
VRASDGFSADKDDIYALEGRTITLPVYTGGADPYDVDGWAAFLVDDVPQAGGDSGAVLRRRPRETDETRTMIRTPSVEEELPPQSVDEVCRKVAWQVSTAYVLSLEEIRVSVVELERDAGPLPIPVVPGPSRSPSSRRRRSSCRR